MSEIHPLTVYYDGDCALCRREIAFYEKRAIGSIEWCDVSAVATPDAVHVAPDLTRTEALARFHIRSSDGTLQSGAKAFASLWRSVPGFGFLARFVDWKPGGVVAEAAYVAFLHIRPLLVAPLNAWDRTKRLQSKSKIGDQGADEPSSLSVEDGRNFLQSPARQFSQQRPEGDLRVRGDRLEQFGLDHVNGHRRNRLSGHEILHCV